MKVSYNIKCCCFGLSVLLALLLAMSGDCEAATYVVGDSSGWTIPPNGPSMYETWASQHVFRVGDVLVFNFTTGVHDVAQVTKQGFDSCSSNAPLALVTVGPASLTLNSTGTDYYICTFGQHCSFGQKLAINVTSASASPMPSPTPSNPRVPTPSMAPPQSSSSPTSSMTPGPAPSRMAMPSPISPAPESTAAPPPGNVIPVLNQPPSPPPNSAPVVTIGSSVIVVACVVLGLIVV